MVCCGGQDKGLEVSMDEARAHIYGMSYDEWKEKYQKEATPEQQEAFRKVSVGPDSRRSETC
jgi:hypothetical protein